MAKGLEPSWSYGAEAEEDQLDRFLYQYFSSGDILEMLHGPADEGFDVGHKGFACLCEGIFHAWWDFGIGFAFDKVIPFEVFQCGGEHLL